MFYYLDFQLSFIFSNTQMFLTGKLKFWIMLSFFRENFLVLLEVDLELGSPDYLTIRN